MKDYPAAHSADTTWYCVDECGHVATCWSSESGAVPKDAATEITDSPYQGGVDWQYRQAIETINPAYVVRMSEEFKNHHSKDLMHGATHILSEIPADVSREIARLFRAPSWSVVRELEIHSNQFKLSGKDPVQKKLSLLRYRNQDSTIKAFHNSLHARNLCICCGSYWGIQMALIGQDNSPTFYYRHPLPNGRSYPYFLSYVPSNPKTINKISLSSAERKAIKRVVVPGCFANLMFWQPTETHRCYFYPDSNDDSVPVDVNNEDFMAVFRSSSLFGFW